MSIRNPPLTPSVDTSGLRSRRQPTPQPQRRGYDRDYEATHRSRCQDCHDPANKQTFANTAGADSHFLRREILVFALRLTHIGIPTLIHSSDCERGWGGSVRICIDFALMPHINKRLLGADILSRYSRRTSQRIYCFFIISFSL